MRNAAIIAAVIALAAATGRATHITNEALKLTVDYTTGQAWIGNTSAANVSVEWYSIQSQGQYQDGLGVTHGYLYPGTRAWVDDDSGEVVWTPGAWKSIGDSFVVNPVATATALTGGAGSFGCLQASDQFVCEATVASAPVRFKTGAAGWDIGYPVLPGKANLANLSFMWMTPGLAGDVYVGRVEIINTPEPATLALMAAGALAMVRRRRQRR